MRDSVVAYHMQLFAIVDEKIDAHSYPATAEELIEEYGDLELELPNGAETLGDVLGRIGDGDHTFEDAEAARMATYSGVSNKAIGRRNYSDRDSPSINEEGPDQVSF